MAIAYVSAGAQAGGTTSVTCNYPAAVTAGNILVLGVVNKYPTNGPQTPTGWTAPANNQGSGGSGSSGLDTGNTYATVFVKIADGTEGGTTFNLSIPSGNSTRTHVHQYSKASDKTWGYYCVGGASNTPGTTWTSTFGSDPGIRSGDMLYHCFGPNSDAYTWSSHLFTVPGIETAQAGSERTDNAETNGDDLRFVDADRLVGGTGGVSNGAPSVAVTASGSTTNAPAGGAVLLVLRELTPTTGAGGILVRRRRR